MTLFLLLLVGGAVVWLLTRGTRAAPQALARHQVRSTLAAVPTPRVQSAPSAASPSSAPPSRGTEQVDSTRESVTVGGYGLRGRMLYVGEKLSAISEWRGTEPALINPVLTLETNSTAIQYATTGYWPSYSDVSPTFRAKYLGWLAGGRQDPDIDIGCVFLFFYGLERRVLTDLEQDPAPASGEVESASGPSSSCSPSWSRTGGGRGAAGAARGLHP